MIEDSELLLRYAKETSEAAFAELVQRHVNFVYACALRRVGGDVHLAEDVTQQVFTVLACSAAALARREVLSGWLYTTARNASAQVVRSERRRQARETEVQIMNELTFSSAHDAEWKRLRPVIDDALDRLSDDDRQAVLLRFFEAKSFADVGAKLRLTENTARMRVERALDKLRTLLERRGVTSTTAALAVALANEAVVAAPAGLVATVTGAVLAGASAGGGAWATLMSMTKLQVGIASALALAGATGFVIQASDAAALQHELTELRQQNQTTAAMQSENAQLARGASEAEAVRVQTTELAQLRDEAAALRNRLQAVAVAKEAKPAGGRATEPPFSGPLFEPRQLDQQPKLIAQARPLYPVELRRAGLGGEALVDFIVDAEGAVHNVTALATTHPAAGDSAVEAVSQWQFEPAQKNGRPVATHLQVPIRFTLTEDKSITLKPSPGLGMRPPLLPDGSTQARPIFVPWF